MTEYHEPFDVLPEGVRNIHRALRSLIEEVEAIDWYHQRVAVTQDAALRAVLAHNRDEEIEHACMALEWLRRNMDGWDGELREYLFTDKDIVATESAGDGGHDGESAEAADDDRASQDLGIGGHRKEKD